MKNIIILILFIFCTVSVLTSIYLYKLQEEVVLEQNKQNISKRIMNIQIKHQRNVNDIYFILPDDYASDEIDEYVENYGKNHNLTLEKIFFEYNYAIYHFKR